MADQLPASLAYVDDPSCHEIFAEDFQVLGAPGIGIIRIEFAVYRFAASSQGNPVPDRVSPVARIALPLASAAKLVNVLSQTIGTAAPRA